MRRAAALVSAAFLLSSCRGTVDAPQKPQPVVAVPVSQPYILPAAANFLIIVSEAVPDFDSDLASYVKIFADGKLVGQTELGPKSKEKMWGDALEPGNHLFRFEAWVLPMPGEWTALQASWQPPERFIRVEAGQRVTAMLKFVSGGRRHTLQLSKETLK